MQVEIVGKPQKLDGYLFSVLARSFVRAHAKILQIPLHLYLVCRKHAKGTAAHLNEKRAEIHTA